jgi:DnaK suppressor protein
LQPSIWSCQKRLARRYELIACRQPRWRLRSLGYDRAMNPERARELLAEERRRLEDALAGLARADTGELAEQDDPADQASDLYTNELDEGLSDELREALAAVERAEARLAAGTYGLSVESGQPIPDDRLEAIPAAERTVEEQERYDRRRS